MASSTALSLLLFPLLFALSHAATFEIVNQCSDTVWAAAVPGGGTGRPSQTGSGSIEPARHILHTKPQCKTRRDEASGPVGNLIGDGGGDDSLFLQRANRRYVSLLLLLALPIPNNPIPIPILLILF
ncbi:hypothetical protein C4D60_Mb04t38530 [Musa balbisiana]|uniref:Uncharacterized protein n=1 Tax=Musa balbisiana TaxID=52838 RepID=A0A4V4HAC3_MUSBA|nr:hypothetical protein C4D60_Mb04t38530 [Musa balbisiana]